MKNIFVKMSLKQKLILVVSIIIFIFLLFLVASKRNSPEKVIKEYCNILVNGNYGDTLDIAYFPDSEYITKDKIEELKKVHFENMKKQNNNITSCTYTKANETDEYITYKLIMETTNGKDTSNIEVRKDDNKIVLDGLYKEKSLTVFKGSTVYIDNEEVSFKPKANENDGNQVEVYVFMILYGVNYDVKITHQIFKDEMTTLEDDTNYTRNAYGYLKDDIVRDLETNLNDMFVDIVTVTMEEQDIKPLNKYFLNNNAEDFIKSNDRFKSMILDTSDTFEYVFKSVDKIKIEDINFINDKELFIQIMVYCNFEVTAKNGRRIMLVGNGIEYVDSYEDDKTDRLKFNCAINKGKWKISSWNEKTKA